jgi:anti-sigma regulatory factor (Ser/Thr protein kinase)/anti-anti-sigma regulatory factor
VSLTVVVTAQPADDIILITLGGVLSLDTVPLVRRTLMKCLAEAPAAVIVETSAMSVDDRSRLTVFLAAAHTFARSGTALLMCGASAETTAQMGGRVLGDVPAFPTYSQARAAVINASLRTPPRVSIRLAGNPDAPRRAREMVAGTCRSWNLDHLTGPATLVVSELVSNAVQHAHTDVQVDLVVRGDYLHLSVRDDNPHTPVFNPAEPREGVPPAERGRGLRLVEVYTTAWGSRTTTDTKTVWATLRATPMTPRYAQPS